MSMNVIESLEKCIVILGGVRPRVDQPEIFGAAKAVTSWQKTDTHPRRRIKTMAQFETWLQSDLTKPLKVQALHGVFFSADNAANLIGVEVFNNGAPASLSGTCIGYAIRADGGTLIITGTVSGNKASIILPTSAYVIEGPLDIVIKVVSGSAETTVGACHGYVQRATTDTIIDPGHVVPDLAELLAQIDACEQATTAANIAAAGAKNAFADYNSTDALAFLDGVNRTHNGITFQWNADGSCTVSGTATAMAFSNKYYNTTAMPDYFKPGSIVYFRTDNAQSDKIYLEVYFYKNGSYLSGVNVRTNTTVTIPSDAQGMLIRLRVDNGATVDTTVKYAALTTASNAELYAILTEQVIGKRLFYSSSDMLPSCDLNDVLNGAHVLIDSNTYQNSPENSRVGYLFSYPINNIYLQIFYGFNTASVWKRRCLNDVWSDWIKIGGENITNEYTFNNYENSYSVTASPSITTDTNAYLAPTGDATDRTADIITLLSTQGVCRLGKGNYYVKDLVMPVGTSIIGSGNATHIIRSGTDDGFAIKMGSRCTIKDCWIMGSSTDITIAETLGNRHGILWQGTYTADQNAPLRSMISNVYISGFTGGGITCSDTGTGVNACIMANETYITNCSAGINITYRSEFNKFTNVHSYANWYGCINNGGNNVFTACDFSGNKVGFLMDNASGQSPNNSHGSAVGCVFNHTNSNSGIGIKVLGCENGYVFTGCQIFFSQIYIENSAGVTISDCNFGADNCSITVKGGGATLFANNMHQAAPTITITGNTNVHFANCYVRSTGAAVSA